jgi:hypothetical protein
MLHNQNNGHHQQESDDLPAVPCIVHEDGVHLTFALYLNEYWFRLVIGFNRRLILELG